MKKVFILQDLSTNDFLVFETKKAALKEYKAKDCIFREEKNDEDFRRYVVIYSKILFNN